jgi:hypothetical protein
VWNSSGAAKKAIKEVKARFSKSVERERNGKKSEKCEHQEKRAHLVKKLIFLRNLVCVN